MPLRPSSWSPASPIRSDVAWRLIQGDGTSHTLRAARGALNMAIDDALLASVRSGAGPILRLYLWQPACLSFGRNQITNGVYVPGRLKAAGIDCVRRPTGGLAVLHHLELTYSVAVPADLLGGPRATYETLNRAIVSGLVQLGVSAQIAAASNAAPKPDALNPCFHAPAAGEVVVGADKLVGSAQRREGRAILQHGSILIDGAQSDIVAYQIRSHADGASGVTLKTVLGRAPGYEELAAAVTAGFADVLGTRLAPSQLSEAERATTAEHVVRYDDPAWTWRR